MKKEVVAGMGRCSVKVVESGNRGSLSEVVNGVNILIRHKGDILE